LLSLALVSSHKELIYHINPDHTDAKMPIDKACFGCYDDLFNMSWSSRYSGFIDIKQRDAFMKFNLLLAKQHLSVVKKYCQDNGVKDSK
jgi:hypothetical protein